MQFTKQEAIKILLDEPIVLGNLLGFDKLTDLHNDWIRDMVLGSDDATLQAHRGSYKTTCISIALPVIIVADPACRSLFMRKTDTDTREIIQQSKKILDSKYMRALVQSIYNVPLQITVDNASEISTNLGEIDPRGTSQLFSIGCGGSLTGKHFDRIFTDDIINIKDRYSKAERDQTKRVYQELRNLINRGGRIYNTGTPWHKDDAFTLMPEPKRFDCYTTGLISDDELKNIKDGMERSLFSANYELKHISSDDVIFSNPQIDADPYLAEQGTCHIDASYGGSDFTAFTIINKKDGKYYVLGKLWQKHVDDVEDQIIEIRKRFNAGAISCEDNGDKGYLGKALRSKGERTKIYHESMNKHLKITSYLKAEWKNVYFVKGTDQEYIEQICDYNENAEHDDAPDSLASKIRELWGKKTKSNNGDFSMFL